MSFGPSQSAQQSPASYLLNSKAAQLPYDEYMGIRIRAMSAINSIQQEGRFEPLHAICEDLSRWELGIRLNALPAGILDRRTAIGWLSETICKIAVAKGEIWNYRCDDASSGALIVGKIDNRSWVHSSTPGGKVISSAIISLDLTCPKEIRSIALPGIALIDQSRAMAKAADWLEPLMGSPNEYPELEGAMDLVRGRSAEFCYDVGYRGEAFRAAHEAQKLSILEGYPNRVGLSGTVKELVLSPTLVMESNDRGNGFFGPVSRAERAELLFDSIVCIGGMLDHLKYLASIHEASCAGRVVIGFMARLALTNILPYETEDSALLRFIECTLPNNMRSFDALYEDVMAYRSSSRLNRMVQLLSGIYSRSVSS